ncbi:MAG: DNA metabolism protein [Clostridiales bacterium]|nr:DNA metabolism protein [Clostridiales bacterium]
MTDYLYDGTFEGLLTCVYHHYYTDKASGIYPKESYQPSLLNGFMEVETQQDKSDRVYEAIVYKISDYSLRLIYRTFLSGIAGKENVILRYLLLGFRIGPSIGSMHSLPEVKALEDIVRKVGNERERMLQFVRFEVMEGPVAGGPQILYAKIEPEHDVIALVAHHFSERFKHDPVIIHDIGRAKAIVAFEGDWYVTDFDGTNLPDGSCFVMSEDELSYQNLWRTYFDHIAIKERTNPRCQKNHMPVRYWKHLTEVNGIG